MGKWDLRSSPARFSETADRVLSEPVSVFAELLEYYRKTLKWGPVPCKALASVFYRAYDPAVLTFKRAFEKGESGTFYVSPLFSASLERVIADRFGHPAYGRIRGARPPFDIAISLASHYNRALLAFAHELVHAAERWGGCSLEEHAVHSIAHVVVHEALPQMRDLEMKARAYVQ